MVDAGEPGAPTDRSREYAKVMTQLDLEPVTYFGAQSIEGGMSAAERVVRDIPDVEAIIGFNDIMAVGIVKGLHRLGVEIPGRCAVFGIDGLSIGSISTPELSSLALDLAEVGRVGVELVTKMYAGSLPSNGPLVQRKVSHTLLLRESA
jgi:LacI family transcriptional regulator